MTVTRELAQALQRLRHTPDWATVLQFLRERRDGQLRSAARKAATLDAPVLAGRAQEAMDLTDLFENPPDPNTLDGPGLGQKR